MGGKGGENPGGSSEGGGGRHSSASGAKYDDPPNSRLFIVCGKNISEEQFRDAFGVFGTIQEIWVLKDRVTGEPKGVTYIKFARTSEAALAMEEMNGRCIEGSPRPLKVLIAHSRDQGSRREMNEEERLVRLFVVVPKHLNEENLREEFSPFGDLDYVSIVKDRSTKESKGFGYIKYHRMSHAAKAFEECDRMFKPVFAEPKPQKSSYHESSGSSGGDRFGGPGSTASGSTTASMSASYDMLSYMDTSHTNPDGVCRLMVSASASVNQDQLWRLFDIVPGLDYCERGRQFSQSRSSRSFVVVFNNPQSAVYAKEKLHGFEYPPGQRLLVRFDGNSDSHSTAPNCNASSASGGPARASGTNSGFFPFSSSNGSPTMPKPGKNAAPQSAPILPLPGKAANMATDLAHLTETIANATALLQAAGYSASNPQHPGTSPPNLSGETYDPSYCSVKLPAPQPLAAIESPVAERLFLVCTPVPPQLYALKDVFGRFGNLIDIYILNGKTCGYAKYAKKESADNAVAALHGQEICGSRLKVMAADPQDKTGDSGRKRPKISETDN